MADFTFHLPDIGEGIAEAEIVGWHVAVGDSIVADQRLADVMTDKATVEMESPVSGRVKALGGEVGDVIAIGSVLAVIVTEEDVAPEHGAAAPASTPPSVAPPPPPPAAPEPVQPATPAIAATPATSAPASLAPVTTGPRTLASPAVRQRAQDLGIDLACLLPTADGRIRHGDLDTFLAYRGGEGYRPAGVARADDAVRVVGLRRRIAENMAASKRAIPHFTYVEEIDVTELEAMRAALNGERGARAKLTMLPFLIIAACRAIPDFPMINARFDDEAGVVTRFGAVHMGIAVQTSGGLMVPVLRDAQDRNLWQLAAAIVTLAEGARSGSLASGQLSGSTLTLTSLGTLGGIAATPVINRPEVAIICPNRIVERPAFVTDALGQRQIAERKLMNFSISCDHRVVDGHDAASFVQKIKLLLERPAVLLAG
ncbi:2-oxo acid dehydrogenase subunit E2 [Novosphingobium sp. ERN07]|uniref:dihydrolipoamide acetyltransferase family protein n=1 Tax=unclassified Novosphingobium TaxID=2644732 RepID=UPI000E5253B8|nr:MULTISPECIES: dihydrolipoamide acetyltransferase family protein [unclassified Novosphingobium]AXU20919.1 branched-chain alpha-keto acid dehydrogenase subunit E2 [Novosphingobium sp. THN1]NLR41617.1 2-oxo acid dehydrogenase subunit E2 [Novosphingobium sp. ERW19]NLR73291.1 2-oxo acid dehydrogenase subunit E2 [Novosphingobium sp. ERN07]